MVNAYYALFLECRDLLSGWGLLVPPRDNAHAWVRLRLAFASDAGLKQLADALDYLVKRRNPASYRLGPSTWFANSTAAYEAIQRAATALAVLDQIDGDPARRAVAIASLPP